MEMGGYGYEKPDLVQLAEQIYQCKNEKEKLELELGNTRFHYDYIGKRKRLVQHEVLFRLIFIVIIALALYYIIEGCDMVSLDLFIFLMPFLAYAEFKLVKRELKMLFQLSYDWNPGRMKTLAARLDIDTFQNDKLRTKKKIDILLSQIDEYDRKIEELTEEKQSLIKKKQQKEEVLRKKGILFDENPGKSSSGFSLKQEDSWTNSIQELDEFYRKEEEYLNRLISHMDNRIQFFNKEIMMVEEEFASVKKTLLLAVIIFIIIIVVQQATSGILYTISSFLCIIASVIGIFILERWCKQPILRYLVEHEHPLVADYAFTHGMTPYGEQRKEFIENKENYEKERNKVKEKRRMLDGNEFDEK